MDVDLVFKIAAVGILVSVLNQVLTRSGREEQATMTTLAGLIVVLMMVVQKIVYLVQLVRIQDLALKKIQNLPVFKHILFLFRLLQKQCQFLIK